MVNQLDRNWDLRTWELEVSSLDISTTAPPWEMETLGPVWDDYTHGRKIVRRAIYYWTEKVNNLLNR